MHSENVLTLLYYRDAVYVYILVVSTEKICVTVSVVFKISQLHDNEMRFVTQRWIEEEEHSYRRVHVGDEPACDMIGAEL